MIITKGQIVEVNHNRKGTFTAIANKEFDTEKDEWYPLNLCQSNEVEVVDEIIYQK